MLVRKLIKRSKTLIILGFSFAQICSVEAQLPSKTLSNQIFDQNNKSNWVDSVMSNMTLEQKVGQLFMVAAFSNKDQKHIDEIDLLVTQYGIGGLIFFQGGPARQIDLVNRYQQKSKIPLLIAGDWEWGISMRLDSTLLFPRQMMLGAVQDSSLIYEMGLEIARQIKLVGGHINFAPVADINNNPVNPVIGSRSFGEDRALVTAWSWQYTKGLQDEHVMAVAKHFPGHGDTDTDSHYALPQIPYSRNRLDSLELYPFKNLINRGVGGVMVAHLFVPSIDTTTNLPSTLSGKVVKKILKEEYHFDGLIFTDALNMHGVSKYYQPGEADLKAFLAGNDVLLFSKDVPKAIGMIVQAVKDGIINESDLNQSVRKILLTKVWTGASAFKPLSKIGIIDSLNTSKSKYLIQKLVENSITIVSQKGNILPLKSLENLKIASVSIGDSKPNEFQKTLRWFANVEMLTMSKNPDESELKALNQKLNEFSLVIFSFHQTNSLPNKQFGVTKSSIAFVEKVAKERSVIVDMFALPYALKGFADLDQFKAVICSYNDWNVTQKTSAQIIFGAIAAKGKLPVSINNKFPFGTGSLTSNFPRLKYTVPFEVGANEHVLAQIDSLVNVSIAEGVFPGCQILAAHQGKVFYYKNFGYATYDKTMPVDNESIYDLASMTKMLSTTLSLMKLTDLGKFDANKTIGYYLPQTLNTNKFDLKITEVLTHQAGLNAWIPFYLRTIRDSFTRDSIYHSKQVGKWSTQVAANFFIDSTYSDKMIQIIYQSELKTPKKMLYSDLGMYMMKQIIEQQSGEQLNQFVLKMFYEPIGAYSLGYLPLNRFDKKNIMPTENDTTFRQQLIQGYVHDMGAAMLGGVGGHAGLFGNANDVAKLMQMLLNKGYYGDRRYISDSTVRKFTSCQFCPNNRKGLGFDKPEPDSNKINPTTSLASLSTFGHSGFTGTISWADPEKDLIFVFLSNRIYPSVENQKITELGIRGKIHRMFYNSINK